MLKWHTLGLLEVTLGGRSATPTAHTVTVQRFGSGGAVSVDLQLAGYSMPTIATDGDNAWLVMVRAFPSIITSAR